MPIQRFDQELQEIRERGDLRTIRDIQGAQDRILQSGGKNYLNFSSNDYLGLANHPALAHAVRRGLQDYGTGAGAARLVNGSMQVFSRLERALAEFKAAEAALLFNSGYLANLGALSCLPKAGDVIFSDELNHASIIDGIRLSRAQRVIYRHGDVADLRRKLEEKRGEIAADAVQWIVTETVFSMDGDLCPLEEIADLAREFDAVLYLDEAHATGVFGLSGAGLAEGLKDRDELADRLIQMGTLGKALGCFGAYVAGSRACIDFLINRCRPFIFTTAMPPSIAEAALEALRIVQTESGRRGELWRRVEEFREGAAFWPGLQAAVRSQIVPILVGDSASAVALSDFLREQGFWINAIRPPTVPAGTARLRLTLTASHRKDDVQAVLQALKEGLEKLGIGSRGSGL